MKSELSERTYFQEQDCTYNCDRNYRCSPSIRHQESSWNRTHCRDKFQQASKPDPQGPRSSTDFLDNLKKSPHNRCLNGAPAPTLKQDVLLPRRNDPTKTSAWHFVCIKSKEENHDH
jgi:hypothetical protein